MYAFAYALLLTSKVNAKGWGLGQANGKVGWFPGDFVEMKPAASATSDRKSRYSHPAGVHLRDATAGGVVGLDDGADVVLDDDDDDTGGGVVLDGTGVDVLDGNGGVVLDGAGVPPDGAGVRLGCACCALLGGTPGVAPDGAAALGGGVGVPLDDTGAAAVLLDGAAVRDYTGVVLDDPGAAVRDDAGAAALDDIALPDYADVLDDTAVPDYADVLDDRGAAPDYASVLDDTAGWYCWSVFFAFVFLLPCVSFFLFLGVWKT